MSATLVPVEIDRLAHALLFERPPKPARGGAPRPADRAEMDVLWELQKYYARLAEEQWEAGAAAPM